MRFLVINIGSSSCKYALFDANEELVRDENIDVSPNSADVVKYILRQVGNVDEIGAIVHRLVHGGDEHGIVEEITPDLTAHLAKLTALTPLHSPLAVAVIQIFAEFLPTKKQYAVFDSGWFKDLPLVVRIYALPKEITNQHHLFRLGFHGISHEYACLEAAKELKKDFDKSTFISLHLGSGSSIALVHRGKPLDTSMGFTPLAGLPMMTRSGDVDPGIILYLLRNHNPPQHLPQSLREGEQESSPLKPVLSEVEGIRGVRGVMNVGHDTSVDWLEYLLNEESGLKGLSGIDDFRKILDEATFKENAKFALEYFIYHIRKYIGSYLAVAPQLPNAVILTGAIGAGDARFRKMLFKDFALAQRIPVTVITPREELAMMRMVKASSKFKAQNHK